MRTKKIKQSVIINTTPAQVYKLWLNSKLHGKMVGSTATISPKVGGKFKVFDGDIVGQTIELKPNKRIVQLWRYNYSDWPEDQPSKIILELVPYQGKTKLLFSQFGIPTQYASDISAGWKEYYWAPLKALFAE